MQKVFGNTKNPLGCKSTSTIGYGGGGQTDKIIQICKRLQGKEFQYTQSVSVKTPDVCQSLWSITASSSMGSPRKGQAMFDQKVHFVQ